MTQPKTTDIEGAQKPQRWYFRWWAWCLWTVLFVLAALALTAMWVWTARYSLLEQLAIDTLADDGIEAELEIAQITRERAVLRNVTLAYDGQAFFEAAEVKANYAWRDALKGQFQQLEFIRPNVSLEVNAQGKIIDGWRPPSSGEGGGLAVPPRGVKIYDGRAALGTPYGALVLTGQANIASKDNITAQVKYNSDSLHLSEWKFAGQGEADILYAGGTVTHKGRAALSNISHPAIDAAKANIVHDGIFDPKTRDLNGLVSLDVTALETAQFSAGRAQLRWSGLAALPEGETLALNGDWRANFDQARLPDPARADQVAKALSLYEPLTAAPVSEHFAPQLTATLRGFLRGSDVQGSGRVKMDTGGLRVDLAQPVLATRQTNQLTLSPRAGQAAYIYDKASAQITANLDARFRAPSGLSLSGLTLSARSSNGWQINGVDSFAARVRTSRDWKQFSSDGRAVRLSPIDAKITYDGARDAARVLRVNTVLDFDGPLPGLVATGLTVAGEMTVGLREGRQHIDFAPIGDGALRIARAETTAGWTLENVQGRLASGKDLFVREDNRADIGAQLSALSFLARRELDGAELLIKTDQADLRGELKGSGDRLAQDWNIAFGQSQVRTDDLAGSNLIADLSKGTLTAKTRPDAPLEFTLQSPQLDVQSQALAAKGIAIDVAGTPDDFLAKHSGGRIKLAGDVVPALPADGEVRMNKGTLQGSARAYLPKTDNIPVLVEYELRDGSGAAIVMLDALRFTPKGLQPQDLSRAFAGKIADVDGTVSAKMRFVISPDRPLESSGSLTIKDMDFGTAPGPLSGVNTTLQLTSLAPLQTSGRQTLTVRNFDPGLELEDGVIEYELAQDGVQVYSARWPLGDGFFSLDPFTWKFGATENRVTLRLDEVGLGAFLNHLGDGAIQATGDLVGTFPIVIRGINLSVEGGRLDVKNGGVLQYRGQNADALAGISSQQTGQTSNIPLAGGPDYAGQVFEALKDFRYKSLFAEIDGPLDGEITVGANFIGSNPKVLSSQPFEFDVTLTGELFNILRSFNSNAQVKSQVRSQLGSANTAPPN